MKQLWCAIAITALVISCVVALPQEQKTEPGVTSNNQKAVAYRLRYYYEPISGSKELTSSQAANTYSDFSNPPGKSYGSWSFTVQTAEGISSDGKSLILVRTIEVLESDTKVNPQTHELVEPRKYKIEKQVQNIDLSEPGLELLDCNGKKLSVETAKKMLKDNRLVVLSYGERPNPSVLKTFNGNTVMVHRSIQVAVPVVAQ